MREITGPELAILNGSTLNIHSRLEIKNASGTWKDYSALAGKDYFIGVRLSTDVDTPVWSMQATLKRDGEAATESLSPLRGDSTLNVDDALAPAPAINAAREWRVSVAAVASGAAIFAGDWKELCAGYLDKPDFTSDPMTVEGRSVGARLMDSTVRVTRTYAGPFEEVAQQIVDDNLPSPAPTLYIPSPPDYTVTEYLLDTEKGPVSVMDALVTLALATGWTVRDMYDPADSTMKTAIIDPGRERVTADATLTSASYLTVDGASLDVANIRNYIEAQAIGADGNIVSTFATDPASIAAFGGVTRFMRFSVDATAPLQRADDLFNQLQGMVDQALLDLSTPKFDHVVTSTIFWPAEITDLIDWTPNAVHYDSTQRLATFGLVHDLMTPGHGTTQFQCRGTPAGAYFEWIRRQGAGPQTPAIPPAPTIDFVLGEADSYGADEDDDASGYDGGVWVSGRLNAGCAEMAVYAELADGEGFSVDQTSSTEAIPRYRRPDGVEGTEPNYPFFFRLTTRAGFWKRITVVGYSDLGRPSREKIWPDAVQAVDPVPTPADGTIADISVTADPTKSNYAVTVTPGSLDTVNTENWLVITRNGQTVFRQMIGVDLSPVTFLDTGLIASNAYQYDAFIWNSGVSGPKNRWVFTNPPTITKPTFTLGPVALIIGGATQVYMEGTSAVVGANRMAVVKSFDRITNTTFGISGPPFTPFIATDPDTRMKWYKLIAFSTTDSSVWDESDWKWWPGLQPPGSQGPNPPVFVNGTPKRVMAGGTGGTVAIPVLSIQWTATTSGAAQISIQWSPDDGITPYVELARDASVASGTYQNVGLVSTDRWYRLAALDAAGAAISWSAGVHYIP